MKNVNLTDIEIQRNAQMRPIRSIIEGLNLPEESYEYYGKYKAKLNPNMIPKTKNGKIILVTAINPTSAGEGKTTVSIGLSDALNICLKQYKKNSILALREPSLGPVFGIKGGATGGGYAQIYPMEDINLHFTGDFHAITSANNLLCALIDNHIFQGNTIKIDPDKIIFNRCLDLNDRALRDLSIKNIVKGKNALSRYEKFNITAASELMATLALSKDLDDLKNNLGNITIGYTFDNRAVYAKDIMAHEAMTILLKDAIKPNLVQTLEGNPVLVHCGPFANIAHGCNSIIATKLAAELGDYVITEAGFGADLGAEKFIDIKCRKMGITPACVVIVATIRALRLHGGATVEEIKSPSINLSTLIKGLENLKRHIENVNNVFKLPVVVAINKFISDTDEEVNCIKTYTEKMNVEAIETTIWENGGQGGIELAKKVLELCDTNPNGFSYVYNEDDSIKTKILKICQKIYGARTVIFEEKALESLLNIEKLDFKNLPICVAKTQYSLSDNPNLLIIDQPFDITIRDLELRSGAGLIIAIAGNMLLMPGLPKIPQAEKMTISNGIISGLF